MFCSNWRSWSATCAAFLGLAASAGASALPASYSLTDLGALTFPTYPKAPASGVGVVRSTDGATAYAFDRTSAAATAADLAAIAPPLAQPQGDHGAYSLIEPGAVVNAGGLFLGTAAAGVGGTTSWSQSTAFVEQRQADGSFGPARDLWSANGNSHDGFGEGVRTVDVNAAGVALGQTQGMWRTYLLADSATGQVLTLPSVLGKWALDAPIAIDDRGRLLFEGDALGLPDDHLLLLTPDGVPSGPVATPEPSTLALLLVAGSAGLARRRARRASA